MKFIGLMSLESEKQMIKKMFEKHDVQTFSEASITGHTLTALKHHGLPSTEYDMPVYSTLCFAIVSDEKAAAIMDEIIQLSEQNSSKHHIQAFQLSVERMI